MGDLVESTNLLGFPPSGKDPTTIVTVAFDSRPDDDPWGQSIGLFLELARALYASDPDHRVQFVALGAERTTDHKGSRRLAQQLREAQTDPFLVTVAAVSPEAPLSFVGDGAAEIAGTADDMGLESAEADFGSLADVDVFGRAGFDHLLVTGPPDEVGPVLLEWLRSQAD